MTLPNAPCFNRSQLEQLARILGDEVTGSTLPSLLSQVGLYEEQVISTKWKRIFNAFVIYQNDKKCSNQIMKFIKLVAEPTNYLGKQEQYNQLLENISKVLSFVGYEIHEDGKLYSCNISKTLSDAESRASSLLSKLKQRNAHEQVLLYSKAELLVDDYFHAVFEAHKGLFQRLRDLSGLSLDGAKLVDQIFSNNPILIINNYQTSSEENEHKGFSNILRGLWSMFRNTEAHEAKINWPISEQDALDILSMISYCHRRLDNAQRIR